MSSISDLELVVPIKTRRLRRQLQRQDCRRRPSTLAAAAAAATVTAGACRASRTEVFSELGSTGLRPSVGCSACRASALVRPSSTALPHGASNVRARAGAALALLVIARRATAGKSDSGGETQADFLKVLRRKRGSQEEAATAVEGLRSGGFLGGARGCSSAIVACDKGNKWELAMGLLDEMVEQGLKPTPAAFSAAVHACEQGEQGEQAERIRQLQGGEKVVVKESAASSPASPSPETVAGEVLYSKGVLCTRFRQRAAAPERLEKAAELLRSGGHFEETLSYTTALRNCEHGLHWEWALSLLGEMTGRDVEPDVVTYNVAIAACGRGQEWARSLALLEGMPAAGITPDMETYQASALACSRNSEWEQALALMAKAKELEIANAETYHIAMMACASAGAWEATLALLECAGTEDSPKDVSRNLECYGVGMYACMEAAQWMRCLGLLERMRAEEVDPDSVALACAAQACRDGKSSSSASSVIEEMRRRKMDSNVSEVLYEATQAVDFPEVRNPVPLSALAQMAAKEVSLYKYIRKRAKAGDVDSVLEVIERFADERSWLKIQGDQKKELLEATLRPTDRIVEFGCYVGYSSMLMARKLRQLGGQGSVTTCEVDAANAYVARGVIQFAGMEGEVQVRVGCASDWVNTGQLGTIDFLLLDHRGTIYHEDLHKAESSLSPHALVFADNVLYPGAPLFLNYIDVQGYDIKIHELKEFKRPDLDDWVVICTPPSDIAEKSMPESTPPELRRLSAEVDAISWRSQEGMVDWVSFQERLKPIFYEWKKEKGL
eukprot:TRINITY_DN49260_c0_g1_i1.p1 TRINITY_DN49260_c0_g1~~TRINITY_DN49260_c0_g1_i1.p1  ORF type:complete len:800 (-),score=177.01 TRINITY_DN49260_c0_g1_i1:72-2426(-)